MRKARAAVLSLVSRLRPVHRSRETGGSSVCATSPMCRHDLSTCLPHAAREPRALGTTPACEHGAWGSMARYSSEWPRGARKNTEAAAYTGGHLGQASRVESVAENRSGSFDREALTPVPVAQRGAGAVRPVLADAAMSVVNLAEVVGHYARHGVDRIDVRAVLLPLPIEYVAMDLELAYDAGMLIPATRAAGLSLGDRTCLALGRRLGLPTLTAEWRWVDAAAATGVEVRLIR